MKDLLYYNPRIATMKENFHLPGIERYAQFFKHFYTATTAINDRTGTIRLPFKTHLMFPIPTFKKFDRTYESICNDRARELLDRAKKHDSLVYVFWSGGIDSTTVLVSFLKIASDDERDRIVVLMTEDSISENPNFYRDHVRGKLRTDPANMFPYLLGTKNILVGGEGNDQLHGAHITAKLIQRFGPSFIHAPYNRNQFFEHFNHSANNPEIVNFYLDLFERLKDASPVDIVSNHDLIWWINFTTKFQSVYLRVLTHVPPRFAHKISEKYVRYFYDHFFATDEFQLWSMNNQDKKIKDAWNTYKWTCKDIIYDFTHDAEYRDNKLKHSSLYGVIVQRWQYDFIDTDYKFYEHVPVESYYEPNNDFA